MWGLKCWRPQMHFSIHSDGVFHMNYHTNMKAVHHAFQTYQFITLSKIWSQFFVHLYSSASGITVNKPKQGTVFIILGQLKKSKWTHLFRIHAGSRRHPHLLLAPSGKKRDFHKQSSKADNYSVCLGGLIPSSIECLSDCMLIIKLPIQVVKHGFWHHILDHHILKQGV